MTSRIALLTRIPSSAKLEYRYGRRLECDAADYVAQGRELGYDIEICPREEEPPLAARDGGLPEDYQITRINVGEGSYTYELIWPEEAAK